ncbi:MAG: lamin tail domain-containing protein [Actinomycetota bacterium]
MRVRSSARRSVLSSFLIVLFAGVAALPGPAHAAPTELFFSEYIEGTSNNKALEIFNGTGAAVDLATGGYNVQMFFNGNPAAGLTINLTGAVASGDVFVLAQSSANAAILAQADQTSGAGFYNGDDAVALRQGTTLIDVIGQIGFDPGTEWGTGLTSTADNTLRRKPTIEAGDTNGSDAFDPAVEWSGFATDTVAGLGSHGAEPVVVTCGPTLVTDQGTAATRTITAADGDGRVVDISISSVTPSPAPGTITLANLVPAAATGGTASADMTVDTNTPGGSYAVVITATNDDSTPQAGTCTLTVHVFPPARPIYEIQGSGNTSPLAGTLEQTTGVVTVILGSGFFMQDSTGDGDPDTSDGIFVFTGSGTLVRSLSPGDEVNVRGTVVEFRPSTRPRDLTLTEFSPATVTRTGTGAALPSAVAITDRPDDVISPDGIDEFERLEGMLVSIQGPKVGGPTNDFGEFIVAASGDHANTTAGGNFLVRPLAGGSVDYNPERIMVDDEARVPGGTGSGTRINNPQPALTVGETATGPITGALDYQFSNYRVQANHPVASVLPGSAPTSAVADLRAAHPYEGRMATFNVENLFDCVDASGKADDHPSCAATGTQAALETQLIKLAMAFEQELGSPEIVIIEETENTDVLTGNQSGNIPGTGVAGIPPIEALLPRVDGNWDAVSFDASDERGIEVAFVWNTDRVTLHEAFLSTSVLPDGGLFSGGATIRPGREPLVGFFTLDDVDLILVGNHLKSKGGPQFGVDPLEAGDDPLYGAFQPPTRWTETQLRHGQADYVRDLVDLLLAENPGSRMVVGGDLNDFAFPEPGEGMDTVARITTSATDPLTNVIELVPAERRYTFLFEGNSQVLDHMLLNAGMAALLRDQDIAHFNADHPSAFGSNASVTLRSSDHDPLVAYFCTDLTPPSLSVSLDPDILWPPSHKYVTVQASVAVADDRDPAPSVDLVSVTSNEPDDGADDGNTMNDVVVIDDDTFHLRAERSGVGTGRVYTITYRATDACGNETVRSDTVEVPIEL